MHYLEIPLPDPIKLTPAPRTKLKEFRALLLKIFAAWLANEFAVGDTVMEPKTWKLMAQAIAMLPREGGGEWSDLDAFSSDYEWIEQTFFAQKKALKIEGDRAVFDLLQWVPAKLIEMHHFDGVKLLKEAHASLQ